MQALPSRSEQNKEVDQQIDEACWPGQGSLSMPPKSCCAGKFWLLMAAIMASICVQANGQIVNQAVGGISVDGHGAVRSAQVAERTSLADMIRAALQPVPADLAVGTNTRMVSLRALHDVLAAAGVQTTALLPDDIRYLAGLQRVEYVFVFPDEQDIVLAGPAESWKVHPSGDIVGTTTGLPVLQLDDLLIALRTAGTARTEGISCSIDPTAAGRQALSRYLSRQRRQGFHAGVARGVEQALGQQQITLTGVPGDSHFARVLVASDYRMKRLAMKLEAPPIPGLPSFLDLLQTRRGGLSNLMPRWWIATDYDDIARSEDGLAWRLCGRGVKVMTEDEMISGDGSVAGTGKVNPVAQEWSDTMTARYDELATVETVFGQLRNLMDLAVVAALLNHHDLFTQAGCELPLLCDSDSPLQTEKWAVPSTVATECSFIKRGREYIITASGGIQIDSWYTASRTSETSELQRQPYRGKHESLAAWRWNP
jgi:hypothetical protein